MSVSRWSPRDLTDEHFDGAGLTAACKAVGYFPPGPPIRDLIGHGDDQ